MTKHKIDDLFKQKLAGSAFTPSTAAWSKLESQLAQKKKKGVFFYMSIAASLALLLTFGWLIWRSQAHVSQADTIALIDMNKNRGLAPIDSVASQIPTVSTEKTIVKPSEGVSVESVKDENPIKKKTPQSKGKKKPVQKKSVPVIMIQQESNLAQHDVSEEIQDDVSNEMIDRPLVTDELPQNTQESIAVNIPEHQAEQPSKESRSVKLIYTLKPAISAERIAQQAVIEETKKSPLKKAMAFAKNIKENPKGIGNLRDVKNNLLSFNKNKNGSK